jgi:hypothetical protein
MSCLSTIGRTTFSRPGNILRTDRITFSVTLLVIVVLFGSGTSWGQDLGALARQEQARKQAQPVHAGRVFTNDDLVRPRILAPEENAAFEAGRQNGQNTVSPELLEQPPVAEASAETVSLGEVVRQYREQKLARQTRAPASAKPVVAIHHVYENEDMARPEILTPEDEIVYEVGLKKPVPSVPGTPTPAMANASPQVSSDEISSEVSGNEPAAPTVPLGDLARAAYQQRARELALQLEAHRPSRFPFTWSSSSLAYPVSRHSPANSLREIALFTHKTETGSTRPEPDRTKQIGLEIITVRRGDSLWKLARQHLGRGFRWRAFLKANPWIRNPNYLKIGAEIRV